MALTQLLWWNICIKGTGMIGAITYPLYTALLSDSRWIGNPINQGWPTCLRLGSTRNFLITRDRSVGNNVTSTKCDRMQCFSFLCTFSNIDWKMFFLCILSMQNQVRSTNWDLAIDVLATLAINHSGATVSVSPSCLSEHFLNHIRFRESSWQR